MATGMDGIERRPDRQPAVRLQRSYGELETVLERSDLDRENDLAEAIIDALEAVDRAREIADDGPNASGDRGGEVSIDDRQGPHRW
jgi:hypothetical protein